MKNSKLLMAFVAGVGLTLLLTGNFERIFHLPSMNWPVEATGILGTLGLLALVLGGAFILRNVSAKPPETSDLVSIPSTANKFFRFLRNLRRSAKDQWVGGVCGGLAETTPIPSWVWRLGFAAAIIFYGVGAIVYVFLWKFMPLNDGSPVSTPTLTRNSTESFFEFLHQLKRSTGDSWLGGVCGGLGTQTPVPSWVWRLAFAALIFCYGIGLSAYVLMWIFVPAEEVTNRLTT